MTDTEYEKLFFQLLNVVNGFGQADVLRCFENLKQRSTEAEWVAWLRRFGERLLESQVRNDELAQGMVKLGEVGCGEFGEVARAIGTELLPRETPEIRLVEKTEVNPEAKAWFDRGVEQYEAGEYNAALASLDSAIKIEPKSHIVWYNKGVVLSDLGRNEEALKSYERAIAIKPKSHIAWNGKGNVLSDLGRYEDALKSYEQAIAIKPKYHEAWNGKGAVLSDLGRNEEALTSYEQAIAIEQNFHYAWNGKGNVLRDLGRYEDALTSFEQAIAIKPKYHYAWNGKGSVLRDLGRNEEALKSVERAIAIEPKYHEAWSNKGVVLSDLGRKEEALTSYERAIAIQPNLHYAWNGKGNVLRDLGRNEEALKSYVQAIAIQPNFHYAWNGKGNVLRDLGRNEEALTSYVQAIAIEPNFHYAWNGKGDVLRNLGRNEEAIASFDRALKLTDNQLWEAWANRGLAVFNARGYNAAIQNWDDGLKYIQLAADPEGCATLHKFKGDAHYLHGRLQEKNPYPYWREAILSYLEALKCLVVQSDDAPKPGFLGSHNCLGTLHAPTLRLPYLEILQGLAKVCSALGKNAETEECLGVGEELLEQVLGKIISEDYKIKLSQKFASFSQLRVDLFAQLSEREKQIEALELAEARKNLCLGWFRTGWTDAPPQSPKYADIQNLLNPRTAAIYWHVSPAAITTFILKQDQPLVVLIDGEEPPSPDSFPARQLRDFEEWMTTWKGDYQKYRNRKSTDNDTVAENPSQSAGQEGEEREDPERWREQMPARLDELGNILKIKAILPYLKGVDHVILIPHRDLHLLPLHYLFRDNGFTLTYLPSARVHGGNFANIQSASLLSVENPRSDLLFATVASEAIALLYLNRHRIDSAAATRETVKHAIGIRADIFHFTGHAKHNLDDPRKSVLYLRGEDHLTFADIFELDLTRYQLVCLSACETGLTSKKDLIDEFVGLASAFLGAGVSAVVSTLWTVNERSSALVMIKFYQLLKAGVAPAQALKQARDWLRDVKNGKLAEWYQQLAAKFEKKSRRDKKIQSFLIRKAELLQEDSAKIAEWYQQLAAKFEKKSRRNKKIQSFLIREAELLQEDSAKINEPPYEHPYHWAGFTITGNI